MEGLLADCPALAFVRDALKVERFTLVDIGCSGGIDPTWRSFGDRLRVIGFDPNIEECERLQAAETNPGVEFVAGFVGIPPDHPFAIEMRGKSRWGRTPWSRLSIARTQELRADLIKKMSSQEKTVQNVWQETKLADPETPIFLDRYFAESDISDIDFIKLDVDGADFEILHSLEYVLNDAHVLGVGLEVNYHGTNAETDHTFHNTDRFMKGRDFELFNLTTRPYSIAALPSRYRLTIPAQGEYGRPLQGDALYLRDLCSPEHAAYAAALSDEKLLKAAGIFAVFGLPDCAAEVIVAFRSRLERLCEIDAFLDVLALQAQQITQTQMSYKDYLALFENDSDFFYVPKTRLTHATRPSTQSSPEAMALWDELEHCRRELAQARSDLATALARLNAPQRARWWRLATPLRRFAQRR